MKLGIELANFREGYVLRIIVLLFFSQSEQGAMLGNSEHVKLNLESSLVLFSRLMENLTLLLSKTVAIWFASGF